MLKTKKFITLILILTLMISSFALWMTPASAYSGSLYTDDAAMAAKLDAVLNGNAKIFNNSDTYYAVGDSIDNYYAYSWGPYNTWAYQCMAYARAVYYYLNGEDADYYGDLSSSYLAIDYSDKVMELSYEVLSEAGVGCGAYVRTTGRKDCKYDHVDGHSFIILTYDEETMTFLEGNANYAGLIALNTYTWDQFNSWRLSSRNISFIIQPDSTSYSIPGDGERHIPAEPSTKAEAITMMPTTTRPVTTEAPTEPITFDFTRLPSLPGDVDNSGHIDSSDARTALRAAVGLEEYSESSKEFIVLDINSDGEITADDARLILRISVGLPIA